MAPTSPASHKPRNRKRRDHVAITSPEFPLLALLWPARSGTSPWIIIPLILMAGALFRWSLSIWPYSGFASPPMFGDFEAQRHWMELTSHLPVSQWYFHNLQWWGLDYPPLTAYHSWIIGKLGNKIDSSWFKLHDSRGLDDPFLKIFMRASVLVSEYLIYAPAIIILVRWLHRLDSVNLWESAVALTAILMQPATILIDHGHFQYNTVMLGLTAATISSILAGRVRWTCIFFVGALGFKQMALFYAPAVFAYLLGICLFPRISPVRFITIAVTTILAFAVLYAPLLLGSVYDAKHGIKIEEYNAPPLLAHLPIQIDQNNVFHRPLIILAQSIHRIFPFARGLFEDKVANFWCALHTFYKLNRYSGPIVQRAALLATLASITPPCLIILIKPRKELANLAFATTAWGFFLFSFQVHEKNVLLPLLPMTLLLAAKGGLSPYVRSWVGFANILASWTLFPLLRRDGLQVPYYVLTLLWAYLLGLPPTSLSAYFSSATRETAGSLSTLVQLPFYLAMIAWHIASALVEPPNNKPDLWVVANVLIGAAGFGLCYLWCLISLLQQSNILAGRVAATTTTTTTTTTEKKSQ